MNQIVTYDLEDDPLQSIDAQQTDKDGVGKVALGKWKTLISNIESGNYWFIDILIDLCVWEKLGKADDVRMKRSV